MTTKRQKRQAKNATLFEMFWVTALFVTVIATAILIVSSKPSQPVPSQATIYHNTITIAPAHNISICSASSCANYIQAGNFTFITSINATGYLKVTSQNTTNLTIDVWETYASSTMQNVQVYNPYLKQSTPTTYTISLLNPSVTYAIIPVIPGNLILKAYNFNPSTYHGMLNITYFNK
jgi:hypothetical protein